MNVRLERPGTVAFLTGVLVGVLTLVGVAFSACSSEKPGERRVGAGTGGQGQTNGGSSAANPDSGTPNGGNGGGAATASGGSGGIVDPPYTQTCDAEVCTSTEKCVPGSQGTYCVHACPGQYCPPGQPPVPYCTRTGGVICQAQ